jgi:hypothetical protein
MFARIAIELAGMEKLCLLTRDVRKELSTWVIMIFRGLTFLVLKPNSELLCVSDM